MKLCVFCSSEFTVQTAYHARGVCSACAKAIAHEMVMAHGGEPDPRFAPADVMDAHREHVRLRRLGAKQKITGKIRRQVLERDQYRCKQCGDHRDLQVDHIHPEARGGTLELDNLQCLCKPCNIKKGARL